MDRDIDFKVEQALRRRRRVLTVLAIGFVSWQSGLIMSVLGIQSGHARAVDLVRVCGFALMTLVLLWLVFGGWNRTRDPAVRAALNDELTQANRADACRFGFIFTLLAAAAIYAVALFEPVSATEAIPLIIAAGAVSAAFRFIVLDRR